MGLRAANAVRTRLASGAPIAHRLAHRAGQMGVRGLDRYWRHAGAPAGDVTVGGGRLAINPRDPLEVAIYRGLYERADWAIVQALVRPGATCLDIGANIGLYTLLFAHLVRPSGTVIALEPAPETFERLASSTAGLSQVRSLPCAASNVTGLARLSVWADGSGISALDDHGWGSASETVDVKTVRVDEVLAGHDEDIDVLKIDAEGHEQEVIEGAPRLLGSGRVRALMVETNPQWGKEAHVAQLLSDNRYAVFEVASRPTATRLRKVPALIPLSPALTLGQANVLAVREDVVGRVRRFVR